MWHRSLKCAEGNDVIGRPAVPSATVCGGRQCWGRAFLNLCGAKAG
jgi:hypothetical protein